MMKIKKMTRLVALVCSLGFFSNLGYAADTWVGMVTGSRSGTYIKIGEDIAESAMSYGVDIKVKDSKGSLDNIKRMISAENAAFGIVQSDVLGHLKRSDNAVLRRTADKLRMVFPLYNEEVHVFASKNIQSLKDLNGKTVSVGSAGGGSWLTATNIFDILNIKPARILNLDNTSAAAGVLEGNVDAMFYVAGKPVSFFEKIGQLKEDPNFAGLFDNVHFVPINSPLVLREYAKSNISYRDYSWVDGTTDAVAVKAIMVSYDFSSKRDAYYELRCQQLGKIGAAVRKNLSKLSTDGRTPKWKEVTLSSEIGSWPSDRCSQSDSVSDAIERILTKN